MTMLTPVNPRKLAKLLDKLGFSAIRRKGSHIFYMHPDGKSTTVPYHPGEDIGKGLLKSILDDIELSVEEYKKPIKKR